MTQRLMLLMRSIVLGNIEKYLESHMKLRTEQKKLYVGKQYNDSKEKICKLIITITNNALLSSNKYVKYMTTYLTAAIKTQRAIIDRLVVQG